MCGIPPATVRVLSLYRQILKTGRSWTGPQIEKDYIQDEAKRLFRANKDLASLEDIHKKILEASNRLQIGVHYKIPYPRLHHKVSNFGHLDSPDMTFGRSQTA